jgi:hypothetical protein
MMSTVTGIFSLLADAERAARRLASILNNQEIVLVTAARPAEQSGADQWGLARVSGVIPEGEIFVYEDALRHGCSVLVATLPDQSQAPDVHGLLKQEGAVTADDAREIWWRGLRVAEHEHYSRGGVKFEQDEKFYRLGFEAALHAKYRCREYDQILGEMQADLEDVQRRHPGAGVEKAFVQGFERGRDYYQEVCNKPPQ